MTLSELARLANVSVSVASKAFSGKGDVSESMKNHVFEIAKKYRCFHQFYNVPYDHRVVALIIPEAISEYYIKFVEEIKSRLEKQNCTMLLSISNFDQQMEEELIRYYSEHGKVDALIVINGMCDFPISNDIIFVKICGECENADVIVGSQKNSAIDECLNALIARGHDRIAFIGEPLTVYKGKLLAERMKIIGLEPKKEYFFTSELRFEKAGEDGVKYLLSLPEPPTAIIGAYGYIASGILGEVSKRGLSIPEDISVVSFDPYPMPNTYGFETSGIWYDIEKFCDIAVNELCKRFDATQSLPPIRIISEDIFYRGNTV